MADELGFKPALELAALIAQKQISSVELTNYFIQRIEASAESLNAVVVQDFERALAQAVAADETLAAGGEVGPLHGLPMTIKESYNIEGLKTTWGFPMWKDMVAAADSDVVRAFKAAGAHFMGKTNVPLMLSDYQSYNEIYGQTNNPWHPGCTPGGSSGGSAAALAAGLTGLDSGSDIGGSIRNPAHYCGVYGHKPTWNIVSMAGHAPPVVQLYGEVDVAVVGPLARSAADLRLALALTAGPMELAADGWQLQLPPPRAQRLQDLRVAFWHDDPRAPVDAEVRRRSEQVMALLQDKGAAVSDSARPEIDLQQGELAYVNLMQAVSTSGIPDAMYQQNVEAAAAFAEDDTSPAAVFARAAVQTHNDWVNYDHIRLQTRYAWRRFFRDWDVLVCPISVSAAFPHDHRPLDQRTITVNGEQRPYFEGAFWAGLVSLSGLPATVFPTGPGQDGLPIGLQAVGAEFNDYTTIAFADMLEKEMGGFVPPAAEQAP